MSLPGPGPLLTVLSNSQTGHSVVVTSQHSRPLGLHGVPDVAVEVVVPGQQQTAGPGEGHAGDAADDVVVAVERQLLVCSDVKQAASRVIGARSEGKAIREELE